MPKVKPPSFKELVEAYGNPKEAILHLIEVGFSPEQIEWKMGIPYYLTRLYMEGIEPRKGMPFSKMVETYERLAVLRGKKGKETELTKFFQSPELTLEIKARFALGIFTDENLKIGPGMIERGISLATGSPRSEVKRLLIDYGEHGEVAYLLTKPKNSELTVKEVYEAIKLLPKLKKVRERELHVSSMLRVGTPTEAKYIVRLLLGDLKLGYYTRTVIRAAARAYEVPPELIENACAILGLTEGITPLQKERSNFQRLKYVQVNPSNPNWLIYMSQTRSLIQREQSTSLTEADFKSKSGGHGSGFSQEEALKNRRHCQK